jgi:hypothetical protein
MVPCFFFCSEHQPGLSTDSKVFMTELLKFICNIYTDKIYNIALSDAVYVLYVYIK